MSRPVQTRLAVAALLVFLMVLGGVMLMAQPLMRTPPRGAVHVPCLVSHPHCDMPDGRWVTP